MLPDADAELVDLIKQCLQLDPKKRASIEALRKHKYFDNYLGMTE